MIIWLLTLAAKGYVIWFITGIALYPLRSWILMWPHWFAFNLLAYALAPVLPLFRVERLGMCDNNHYRRVEPRLPEWLDWFMTDDNSLCGDAGFAAREGESYWSMVRWLWRNPAVGFERSVLRATIRPGATVRHWGDPEVQDGPAGTEGWCIVVLGVYWNLVWVKRIGARCVKLDIGWQLKTFAEDPRRIATQGSARYAMSIRFPLFIVEK